MKQKQAIYSESRIIYWPAYEAGRIGLIFFGVIGTLFVATSIWILLDTSSRETRLTLLVLLPLMLVVLYAIIRCVLRTMHTKIVVSKKGVEYFNSVGAIDKQIDWKDVAAVYFTQELWYGRKSCKIFFTKTILHNSREKNECDFLFPVQSVDEQKLVQLIPEQLWKNNPW